jgi:hypothetical protein
VRKTKVAFLIALQLALLAGCSALFDFNVFSSLDKPSAPSLNDIKTGGLPALAADLTSPAVVAALAANKTTRDQIKTYLGSSYQLSSPPLNTPDRQDAAALYGDLCLKTTSGDALVNNVVTALAQSPADLSTLLKSIVPADVAADPTKFADMIQGFTDAEGAYASLGDSIAPGNVLGNMNMGDVAQKAAAAYMVETAATTYGVTALYDLVNGAPSGVPPGATFTDPFTSTPSWLQTIFDVSGAKLPTF